MSKELTGKATDKLVPSRATMSVITANVPKARYNLAVGLNSASDTGGMPVDFTCCKEYADLTSCKECSGDNLWSVACSSASLSTTIAD